MKIMLACPNDSPFAASFSEKAPVSVPLGLAYIGAFIRDLPNVSLTTLDNNALKLAPHQFAEIIRKQNPDIIAISILTATVYTTWEMARVAKQICPDVIVVVGGMHCSALPENTLSERAIDYGIVGEGEPAFRELVIALQKGDDPHNMQNLVYRDDDRVVVNPRREPISNLDGIPFPARDLFDTNRYGLNVNRRTTSAKSTTMLTSRGCPYGCIFCSKSIYGRHFNQRSVGNVIEEMKLLEREGYGEVLIVDDTFTVNRTWVLEFCKLFIKENISLQWNCHARVNTLDEEVVRAMKEAHCTGMAFGIESGNEKILKSIDKQITLGQARSAVRMCRKHGITSLCSYIFGHPGDTWQSVNDTLRAALEIDSDYANFCVLVPMPGSRIFDDLVENKKVDLNNWDRYLAHAKEVQNSSLCELTPEQLQKFQKHAFRSFYFRPSFIWRKVKHLHSPAALAGLIRGAYLIILFQLQTMLGRKR